MLQFPVAKAKGSPSGRWHTLLAFVLFSAFEIQVAIPEKQFIAETELHSLAVRNLTRMQSIRQGKFVQESNEGGDCN